MSSGLTALERFLAAAGFDRGPWLAIGYAAGICLWFGMSNRWQWLALISACLGMALASLSVMRGEGRFPYLRQAIAAMALVIAAGCATVWIKSSLVGTPAIARPMVVTVTGTVIGREDQPAEQRIRLVMAIREPESGRPVKVRLNMDITDDSAGLDEGALVRVRVRLMPPAPPMLPGGYDFARTAWFAGLAATGSVLGPVGIIRPSESGAWFGRMQARLSRHVRSRLGGSPGTIAAAFASGDRGAIAVADEEAMRDAGLTHLLSVSGLHVSAVIAAAYFLAIRLLALWPWLALRVRLPVVAAGAGAAAGIFYTLLSGSEVPTVRSCIGALLVLAALVLGREPLSLRMLAAAAFLVMLFWPEAVVSPGFQMSFASVIAIVSLHGTGPVRAFLAPRDETWWMRGLRRLVILFLAGLVIEMALMPVAIYHFHRAGIYGAFANVIAIPLTTFASMPLIALALLLDIAGAGGPVWWLVGKSLETLLVLAHWTASQPGAVTMMPAMGRGSIAMFVAGGLWLALWRGRVRLLGLVPVLAGAASLVLLRAPDILISGDGHHVGITGEARGELLVLRDGKSDFARSNLFELAGMSGTVRVLADWPGARCNQDFCALQLRRGGRDWRLLIARGKDRVEERAVAAACDRADIVIADRWLPRSCRPAVLKADRSLLMRTGGLAIDLENGRISTVADGQGEHGWWRRPEALRTR